VRDHIKYRMLRQAQRTAVQTLLGCICIGRPYMTKIQNDDLEWSAPIEVTNTNCQASQKTNQIMISGYFFIEEESPRKTFKHFRLGDSELDDILLNELFPSAAHRIVINSESIPCQIPLK
jgi:hypothetical protein